MLGWPLTFVISAMLAAAFGFTGIDGMAETIGQVLFAVFLTLFLLAVCLRTAKGKPPV
ncbi:DUF1328 domain-containing protein [Falsirhodobacter sp. 20TX0035]|uniref:DUF1328 domain-containing protein n=1 Tax=Falsirhodobacter sp. 20TX0035 TaxID=3022019 RepID=UPI0023309858|nr:DUF1328 domain-containing protein [Falsirhodobacter sp. 20TX0035]MDB6453938.1 DUF1328 domain-containing protein [Falsirhodobacter sp. 20TX0035]